MQNTTYTSPTRQSGLAVNLTAQEDNQITCAEMAQEIDDQVIDQYNNWYVRLNPLGNDCRWDGIAIAPDGAISGVYGDKPHGTIFLIADEVSALAFESSDGTFGGTWHILDLDEIAELLGHYDPAVEWERIQDAVRAEWFAA
jgi:hypothetical protein